MSQQIAFAGVFEHAQQQHERAIDAYIAANRDAYLRAAARITPDLGDEEQVYTRIAFAILSANCPFAESVKALDYAVRVGFECDPDELAKFTCVPFKATALRAMKTRPVAEFLRARGESWGAYRERLRKTTPGLGRCKASFAVSLLYPTRAKVACLDTWMCKVVFGAQAFVSLSEESYEIGESWVRRFARRHKLPSTFLAQWAIWDHARDGRLNEHDIFPGAHKKESA